MADIALSVANSIHVVESIDQLTLIAGADITAGAAVRINTSGQFVGADGGAAGTADVYGLATRTVKAGEALTAIKQGKLAGYDFASQAFNAPIYLSDTGTNVGTLGDSAGTVTVQLGRVIPGSGDTAGTDKILGVDVR